MATATSAAHHLLRGLELPRVRARAASACCGSRRHACPWPWKTFDRLFPVPGQGTPCSHDATDHLECTFPAAPAYARASAQVVVFSHHSRPTSPRSSQALTCPRLSDQKAREHLSLPFLSGSFISFSFMRLHLICSIQSASISPHMSTRSGGDPMFRPQLCAPSLPSPEPFQLTTAIARSPCLCHSSAVQRSCTLRSPCVPASVRASQKFFLPKWMPLQTCTPPFPLVALTF